jgi:hypothetical protein
VAAVYESADEETDVKSARSFVQPLKRCIEEHPHLTVIVKDKHTEKPFYEGVSNINLEDHVSIIDEDEAGDGGASALEKVLPPILDRPWPASLPPWRIVVLPLPSLPGTRAIRCFIAFAFSHAIGDGVSGLAFHRTFLSAWQRSTDRKESSSVTVPSRTLPAPFDTPRNLPISWSFLLGPLIASYLPRLMADFLGLRAAASTTNSGTWTGSPIFFEPESFRSRVRLLEIEAPLVQNALQASRSHDARLTAAVHLLIVRALSEAVSDRNITNFVSETAVNMRGSIGASDDAWGLFVSGYYEAHPRVDAAGPVSGEMWAAASSMTKNLAECATRLRDQAIGLLRYAPSIRNWTLGKLGRRRDCSYDVSNLLAFDGRGGGNQCKITKMVFAQPGSVVGAALLFNIVSVKGGSLMCVVSWQAGALGVPVEKETSLVDEICLSLRAGFEALGEVA